MQEQAAPPRFRGVYPHKLEIPTAYLPADDFVRSAFIDAVEDGDLKINKGGLSGHFPKLILQVKDKEIEDLAGGPTLCHFDDIDCKDITCTCTDKPRYEQLFAHNTADRDSIVYNNCKRTIFAAAKRQIKSAPVPSRAVADDFVFWAKVKTVELIGDYLNHFGYSFNQWFNHLTYAKQQRMLAVQEFLFGTDPSQEHWDGTIQSLADKIHYEAICKVEVQGPDGKPRMVCAIPDVVKYVMGPVCWKLEEICQEHVPSYCGGKNLTQMQDHINELIDEGFCIIAEGDGSAFDNTQDVKLKALDRFIYGRIADQVHHVPKELFLHIANQFYKVMDVIATIDGKRRTLLTYAVLGTVFSGDCDTTLMNTLRMGFYNWYTNEKAGLKFHQHFVCFSKGDDFTVMYSIALGKFSIEQAYRKYWLAKAKPNGPAWDGCDERVYGLGQILKFIEVGEPKDIKFCSLRAWYVDGTSQHIFLTRDPSKFTRLSKYSRKLCHMSNRQAAEYCHDQAYALRSSYSGLRYFEKFAECYDTVATWYAARSGLDLARRHRAPKDRRTTLPLEAEEQWNGYYYQARTNGYKVHGTYWETMQSIERSQLALLTPDQLNYVNNQIEMEFPLVELDCLVAIRPV